MSIIYPSENISLYTDLQKILMFHQTQRKIFGILPLAPVILGRLDRHDNEAISRVQIHTTPDGPLYQIPHVAASKRKICLGSQHWVKTDVQHNRPSSHSSDRQWV